MKLTLLSLTLGLALSGILVGISPNSKAEVKINQQFVATNVKELIIQIDDLNEKNIAQVRTNLEATGGLTFKGYCKTFKVLMYAVDTDLHPDNSFLVPVFMNLSMGYLIKESGTIFQVQAACGIDPSTIPNNPQE